MRTRREVLLAASSVPILAMVGTAAEPSFSMSTFSVEVTPPIGHPCMGGGIAPVKEILDPLFAHGFIWHGAGQPVAYIAIDWCEIRNGSYDLFRSEIAKAIGTVPVRVMLSALHQHDTPIADLEAQELLTKSNAKGAICDNAFVAKVIARIAKAAKDSLKHSQPITHIGTGSATVKDVASNRRYLDKDGKPQYNRMSATRDVAIRDAELGTIDPELKAISFWNGDKAVLVLNSYATHPMSFYGRGGVTSDFVGLARNRRQAETPGTLQIYLSGCSGNVTAGKFNNGEASNRPALAERIYEAMSAASKATKKVAMTQSSFRSTVLQLSARSSTGFKLEELQAKAQTDSRPFGQCLGALGYSWRKRVEAGRGIDIPVLDFGSAVLMVLPAEAYVEYQLFAQTVLPKTFVMVAGYGECGPGYIPIERAWKENDSNLSDWCWVNPGSEARMKDAIRKVLK